MNKSGIYWENNVFMVLSRFFHMARDRRLHLVRSLWLSDKGNRLFNVSANVLHNSDLVVSEIIIHLEWMCGVWVVKLFFCLSFVLPHVRPVRMVRVVSDIWLKVLLLVSLMCFVVHVRALLFHNYIVMLIGLAGFLTFGRSVFGDRFGTYWLNFYRLWLRLSKMGFLSHIRLHL